MQVNLIFEALKGFKLNIKYLSDLINDPAVLK